MPAKQALPLAYTYLTLPEAFYTRLAPTPVEAPSLVVFNEALADVLGLDLAGLNDQDKAELFAGNHLPPNAKPFAQAYAGHQFGGFTILGDGRAHMLGEVVTPTGQRFDLQYKGSGPTPYSRRGDGRAALGPMLREYVIAEAMHALGIPTTRSLAVAATGEPVIREGLQPGAVLMRVAASHLRVGTFEYAAAHKKPELLQALVGYTLNRHFPELADADNKATALLEAVMQTQADLIVHWMRVGFIHGVMNTDNMALSGETIDYGPCAFMDRYDPNTVFSSIDHQGRYAYANQPKIALWNLTRFAEALLPVIDEDEKQAIATAEQTLGNFQTIYGEKLMAMMRNKLGLVGVEEDDEKLLAGLLTWMKHNNADYTNTFRDLKSMASSRPLAPHMNAGPDTTDAHGPAFTCGAQYHTEAFRAWHADWQARLERGGEPIEASQALMQQTNPAVIPRNHKVEEALTAATAGDIQTFQDLLTALQSPYEEHEERAAYQSPAPADACRYQTFCGT